MMAKSNKNLQAGTLSRATRHGLALMAAEIRLARKKRKMTESDLATRVGCSRDTIRAIEAGKPTVAIAYVFEAAFVLGIDLFGGASEMDRRLTENRAQLQLLPASARARKPEFRDDF